MTYAKGFGANKTTREYLDEFDEKMKLEKSRLYIYHKSVLKNIVLKLERCIVESTHPNQLTKRGGEYRIGMRKAIDLINDEIKNL